MKKIGIFLVFAAMLMAASCNKKPSLGGPGDYNLTWDMKRVLATGNSIDSVSFFVNGQHVSTLTEAENGKYVFKGEAAEKDIAKLVAYVNHSEVQAVVYVALEAGDIAVENELQCADGTPVNYDAFDMISKVVNGTNVSPSEIISFVQEHSADVRSLLVVGNEAFRSMVPPADMQKLFELIHPELKNSVVGKEIKAAIDKTCSTLAGAKFVDFAATYKGKTEHLSDYVGKGKIVVADFWASWCVPCRNEIPNLIELYKKYGDKIVVLGIATWDDPEETKKAITELKIPYPQMLNAQNAGSDAYSIMGIPEIIVFSPDGTILQRGLRGKELDNAVAEALKS